MKIKLLSLIAKKMNVNGLKSALLLTALLMFGGVSAFSQGTETFSATTSTGSYGAQNFTGDDGSTWSISNGRTDLGITGRGVTLNDNKTPAVIQSGTITGGVGSISVSTQMPYSDNGTEPPSLYINTTLVGTLPYGSSVQTTTFNNVNISGDFYIKIDNSSLEGRITFDDITWTAYSASSGPSITNISHLPVSPTSSDAVSVSADITDSDGIGGAEIHWGTTSGSLGNTISMTNTSGDTYETDTDIPAQSNGTTVYFEVYALDNNLDETTSAEQSYSVVDPPTTTLDYSNNFDIDLGDCFTYSVSGATKEWGYASNAAAMNGYNSGDTEEDWLIIPGINFNNYSGETMTFTTEYNYGSDDADNYLKLLYSTDYSGIGDPSSATWTELSYTQPSSNNTETGSDDIDLSSISGTNVYIAFKYHYESGSYRSWIVDNILIEEVITTPEITASESTLTGFTYEEGSGPSSQQTFTISGSGLVGSGNITVTGTTNYEVSTDGSAYSSSVTYPFASGIITDQPKTVYVRLKSGLATGDYNSENIQISGGSATAINVGCSGTVTAVDNTAPTVTTFSPLDDATDVAIGADLVLTFDETVQVGSGNIVIKEVSGGAEFQTIAIGLTTISGNTVTISHNDFDYNTAYYVEITSGVITDEATIPNDYAGISGSTAWSFTTIEEPVPANVFISEISPKGSGGDYENEFIEISNTGGSSVDLTNWTLEYWQDDLLKENIDLTGSVAADDAYIVALRTSGSLSPDISVASSMSGPCYVILKESGVVKDEAGTSSDQFSDNTNYELTDCGADNSVVANWDDIGSSGVGTPGVVNCVVTEQEINIQANATNFASGSTYDFGDVENGVSSSVITFTIQNTGTLDLTLTGTPKIVKSGTHQADYDVVETSTTSPISGGGTTAFTIQFTPSALGSRTATISIANNDADENPYTIDLTGNCIAPDVTAPIATFSPSDDATNVDNTTNLVLTFDENVDAGTGDIEIRRTSDDGLVESFDVTSDVSIFGTVVTINPTSDLSYSTEYYVLIDATAIVDEATIPNNYAGISSTTAWSFTTMAMPSVPVNIIPCRTDYVGYPNWTDTDVSGSGYVVMNQPGSTIISPAMNFDAYTGETLYFDARTYGGATDTEAVVTVSISDDNGSSWNDVGTGNPTTSSMDSQTPIDLSSYSGTQVKIKFEALAANNNQGPGVDNICIEGSIICELPTVQASDIIFSNISAYSMQIDWTNGNGINRAVFVKEGSGAITNPINGVTYAASSDWSSKGTQLGTSGYYCVYNGSGTSVTLTNLDENTDYYVQIFEYGCATGAEQYYTATETDNPNNESTTVANPTLVASPASLSNLDYNLGSGPSVAQSFDISGTDLTAGPITITAPTNFLVCSTEGGTYVSSYTIPYTAPNLASTTVYVKLADGLGEGVYSGNITCTGGSATTLNVAVSGNVLPSPGISITETGPIALNTICDIEGTYSNVETFHVTGNNLTDDLTIGFPFSSTKLELSSDGVNYFSAATISLSFTPVANSVNETIYVRSVGGEGPRTFSTAIVSCKSTGTATKTIDVTYQINDGLDISTPSDVTAAQGNSAVFSVTDEGYNYQWQEREAFPATEWTDIVGATSNTLTIPSVSLNMDQYDYRIQAYDGICTDESSIATLTVTGTPTSSCGNQTFDNGTTPPLGWTFTNINSTNGSALEMDATGDKITSSIVTAPSVMSFWLQGLGTMTGSSLLVEGFNGFSWNTIENITSIPTSATTKTYTVAGNSIDNYSKFRFKFTKGASSANIAFDDVDITCGTEPDDAWILDESFDNITSIADITNNLTDVPGFTATDAGGATLETASITCKYNRNPGSLKFDGTSGGTITITTPTLSDQPDLLTFYTAGVGNGDLEVQASTTAKASFTTIYSLSTIVGPGTIHFVPLNTDVVKVRFVFTQGSDGYAYFDDIRIRDASAGGNSGNDIKILQTLIETCNLGGEGEDEFVLFKTGSKDVAVSDLSVIFPGGGIGGNEHSMDATNQFISNPGWISDVNDIVELTNPGCRPVKEPIAGVIPADSYAIVFTGNSPEKYDFKEICPSTTYYAIFSNNTNGTGKYTNTPDPGTNYYTSIIDKSTGSYDTQFYNSGKTCGSGCTAYYDESTRNLTYDANGCNMTLLPIELVSFTADCEYGSINLKWVTSSEINNDYFTIEKSYDMKNWDIVSVISGAGNSSTTIDYSYIDSYEYAENVYYRLKQTDYNGDFSYSAAIAANCYSEQDVKLLLYPNPANNELKCEFYSPFKDNYIVEIINTYGQTVLQKSYELHEDLNFIDFDLSKLSEGVYYFKIYSLNGDINEIKKIVKQ